MNEPSEIDRVENVSEEQRSAHRALDRNVKVLGLVSLLNAASPELQQAIEAIWQQIIAEGR